jgi:hypothetical protein
MSGTSLDCHNGGTEVVLFPLRVSESGPYEGMGSVSIGSQQGMFVPITLPIFGSINDNKGLDDIEGDANTECIEAVYKMKIDRFVEAVVDGKPIYRGNQKVYGMYVHRKVYNAMSRFMIDEFGKQFGTEMDQDVNRRGLRLLGFSTGKDSGFPFDDQEEGTFKHPKINAKAKVETFIDVFIDGKEIYFRTMRDFVNALIVAGYEKQLGKAVEKLNLPTCKYAIDEALAALDFAAKRRSKETDDLPVSCFTMGRADCLSLAKDNKIKGLNDFLQLYEPALRQRKLDDQFTAFKFFEHNLAAVNRVYMPTFGGYQDGNYYMERALYEVALDIAKAKIARKERDREV